MFNALLSNTFVPVTFSFGFVESPISQLSDAFISWQEEIFSRFSGRIEFTPFSAPLDAALRRLEPLTTPQDRYVLVETRSNWTAIFSNGLCVNDVFSPVSYLPTVLKCRGLEVTAIPDRSKQRAKDALRIWGAVKFALYGPEKTDWLNRIRQIVLANDIGGWEFAADGPVQPFEKAESYQKRRVNDRFTVDLLDSYCTALGIRLFDADFYGGECLLSQVKRAASSGPTMTIAEARSHLYL